jgi:hypothetical protein
MGVTYHGPYADAIAHEEHEGCAARILPDSTETAVWLRAPTVPGVPGPPCVGMARQRTVPGHRPGPGCGA